MLVVVSDPERAVLLERLTRLDAVLAERDALIEVLTRRVAELEALLRKDSRTSSGPPSTDGPAKPPKFRRESSGRSPGKQPGAAGFTLRQLELPDWVVTHRPARCSDCAPSLQRGAPVVSTETRQVFDPPVVRLVVVEHRLQHRRCGCGAVAMARVPKGWGHLCITGRGCVRWGLTWGLSALAV
jgi:hypothetical protein